MKNPMINESDVTFTSRHEIVYKGVNLGITRENIQDYEFQTGFDAKEMILDLYRNSIPVLRDKKLEEILK